MIYYHNEKVCIVTPPKCGTTSLHWAMCPPAHFCEGPQLDGIVGKHSWVLPFAVRNDIKQHTILIVARHPYKRFLSLYGHWKMWWERPDGHLQEFVDTIAIPNRCNFLSTPISSWVYRFQQENPGVAWHPFQLEQKEYVLEKFNLDSRQEIPWIYRSEHGSCEEEYTRNILEYVRKWAYYDFKLFGYSEEPWWDVRK